MIANSYDGNRFLKQMIWIMIDRSCGLSREVGLSLIEGSEYEPKEINVHSHMFSEFTSSNCFTHLNQLMTLAGSTFIFSVHYGAYEGKEFNTLGIFPGSKPPLTRVAHPVDAPMRYTFWLAKGYYGECGKPSMIRVKRSEIESVDLSRPGLMPFYEKQDHVKDTFPHSIPYHLHGPRRKIIASQY